MNFEQPFRMAGLKGFRVNVVKGDVSVCSGCYGNMEFTHAMYAKDNPGLDPGDVETCIGRGSKANAGSEKVFLFGNCSIEANKDLKGAIKIAGCPPDVGEYLPALMNATLKKGRARKLLIQRMAKMIGFKMGLYHEDFGLWEPYGSAAFDLNHYR